MQIIEYTPEAYKQYYDDECISIFTHSAFSKGIIDKLKADEIIKQLNLQMADLNSSITFHSEMITSDQHEGGACSAVSFQLAKRALSILGNSPSSSLFLSELTEFVTDFENIAKGTKSDFESIQRAIRNEQMALNTIHVDLSREYKESAVHEKVSAIAQYYGLQVVESSDQIKMKNGNLCKKQLKRQINQLKDAVYILRTIEEASNHKLEIKGHSVVFIKHEGFQYYFDPALGFFSISSNKKSDLIYNSLLSVNKQYGVDALSFHRLKRKTKS